MEIIRLLWNILTEIKNRAEITAGKNLADIFDKSELQGYIVEKITSKEIVFDNGFNLPFGVSESCSELKKIVQKEMLKQAIDLHFEKEQTLFLQGIKALSLFFIDRVDDYLGTETKQAGELAQDFEILYQLKKNEVLARKNLSEDYRAYLLREARVHNGYFSRSNNDKDNQETIDLILREKEKLLSLETLRFIFSKWALQEGLDNPNIFTLTKLAPSASHILNCNNWTGSAISGEKQELELLRKKIILKQLIFG